MLRKFVMERDIPQFGAPGAAVPNAIEPAQDELAALTRKVRWVHSLVAANKTFCFYLAEDEAAVKRHAELSGFPADIVTEIETLLVALRRGPEVTLC